MRRKSIGLWDVISGLFGDKVIILVLTVFVIILGLISWLIERVPSEHQVTALFMIAGGLGCLAAIVVWLVREIPCFIKGFFMRR